MKRLSLLIILLFFSQRLICLEHGSTSNYYVGALAGKWQFPSDHLPVGLSIRDVHVVLWNTLNTRYIYHIHTNHQGLKGSLITETNIPKDLHSKLTVREEIIIKTILEMIEHPHFPRSLLVLQEMGEEVFKELENKLPKHMVLVTAFPGDLANGDIFVYDKNRFEYISLSSECYQVRPRNTYMTLTLQEKESGILYRFIQSHVPGGPVASSAARREWAESILLNFNPEAINLVLGDMNRSPDYFLQDLQNSAEDFGFDHQPFNHLWVPYPTHIDTYQRATWIDNFFIYTPNLSIPIIPEKDPENLCESLEKIYSLLRNLRPYPLEASFQIWSQVSSHRFGVFQVAFGGSGQEQLYLGLTNQNYWICNLFQMYNEWCQSEKTNDPECTSQLEMEWIQFKKESILDICKNKEVIIFDQFDLLFNPGVSNKEKQKILELIDIADTLHKRRKTVVLVIDQSSANLPILWEHISEKFSMCRGNLVQQGFFSNFEEDALLSFTSLSDEEKIKFKSWAQGTPSSYVVIMEQLCKNSGKVAFLYDQLCEEAITHLNKVWSDVVLNDPPHIKEILMEIAKKPKIIDDLENSYDFSSVINTGLIGHKQGKWWMPQIVRDFLINL